MKFNGMTYQIAADLVYKLVCADASGEPEPITFEYEGQVWEVYNYHDGKDGASPAVVLSRQTEDCMFYSTFYYCRAAKKIIGFKHEGFSKEDYYAT